MIQNFLVPVILLFSVVVVPLVATGGESLKEVKEWDPPSSSVEVKFGAFLIDLTKIDDVEQMFNADVIVRIKWNDPRLADATAEKRTLQLSDVWTPNMQIVNLRDVKLYLPKVVHVSPDGDVVYIQRAMGDFTARMDLREFPDDTQHLGLEVVAQGYTEKQVRFVPDPDFTGSSEDLTVADWAIGEVEVKPQPYAVPKLGEIAGVIVGFEAKRHVSYYYATIFASAIIIGCMAWMVFWMSPDAINPRISISVTSMLTLIAYRFVAGSKLPKLAYLTHMDYFLLGATIMVLLGLIGVVTVHRVSSRGRPELGLKLNRLFRWIYPIIFIGIIVALKMN